MEGVCGTVPSVNATGAGDACQFPVYIRPDAVLSGYYSLVRKTLTDTHEKSCLECGYPGRLPNKTMTQYPQKAG